MSTECTPALNLQTRPPAILVVEDEVLIRILMVEELSEAGFHVIEAANADEAFKYLLGSEPVDLVFTDVRMPGSMDGLELASRIRSLYPDIKIVLTSGHLSDRQAAGVAPLVSKPYVFSDVISLIQAELDQNGGDA